LKKTSSKKSNRTLQILNLTYKGWRHVLYLSFHRATFETTNSNLFIQSVVMWTSMIRFFGILNKIGSIWILMWQLNWSDQP